MEIVIDTSVAIDILRRSLTANEFKGKQLHISLITIYELFKGVKKSEVSSLRKFIATIPKLPQTELTMEIAALIKRNLIQSGQDLDSEDIFIAANCLEFGLPLQTANKKHFERVEGLQIVA